MKQKLLLATAVVYILAQFIAPAIGLALALNFDKTCYSGSISFLERVSDNSSCGAGGNKHIGFPFIVTSDYNSPLQKVIALMLNLAPLAVLVGIVMYRNKSKQKA